MSIGILMPAYRGGADKVKTVGFLESVVSTTNSVVIPSTVRRGDIGVMFSKAITNSANIPLVVPAGWEAFTDIYVDTGSSDSRGYIAHKILGASDAGATISGMTGDLSAGVILLVFRPDIPANLISPVGAVAASGNGSSRTIVVAGSGGPMIVVSGYYYYSGIGTRTFSPAQDAEVSNTSAMYDKYKISNTSPFDTTESISVGSGATSLALHTGAGLLIS